MDLILNTTYNIFELLYNAGSALWYFFSMPLSDQIGMPDDIVAFLVTRFLSLCLVSV